jgi:L-asparaginase
MNTYRVETFQAPDSGAVGYIQSGTVNFYKQPIRKHTTQTPFTVANLTELPRVDIVYIYANASRLYVDTAAKAGVKGLVSAGVGDGSLYSEVRDALSDAQKQGVVVVRSSRVNSGMVARNGAVQDDKYNFVVSDTLNAQKARILLMLALTKTSDLKTIQQMFWEY